MVTFYPFLLKAVLGNFAASPQFEFAKIAGAVGIDCHLARPPARRAPRNDMIANRQQHVNHKNSTIPLGGGVFPKPD